MDSFKEKLTAVFHKSQIVVYYAKELETSLKPDYPDDAVAEFTRLIMATGAVVTAQHLALTIAEEIGMSPEQVDLSFIKYD
jgi:hypothetical protein